MNFINSALSVLLAATVSTAVSANGDRSLRGELESNDGVPLTIPKQTRPTCTSLKLGLTDCDSCMDYCKDTWNPVRARCNGNGRGGISRCWCIKNYDARDEENVLDCTNKRPAKK